MKIKSASTALKISLFTLAMFLLPAMASAKVSYLENTALPQTLQVKIPTELAAYCPAVTTKDLSVKEVSTDVDAVKIDNGKTDYFYHTTFQVYDLNADGSTSPKTIFVYSAQYALDNGDNTEIQSIFGLEFVTCQ